MESDISENTNRSPEQIPSTAHEQQSNKPSGLVQGAEELKQILAPLSVSPENKLLLPPFITSDLLDFSNQMSQIGMTSADIQRFVYLLTPEMIASISNSKKFAHLLREKHKFPLSDDQINQVASVIKTIGPTIMFDQEKLVQHQGALKERENKEAKKKKVESLLNGIEISETPKDPSDFEKLNLRKEIKAMLDQETSESIKSFSGEMIKLINQLFDSGVGKEILLKLFRKEYGDVNISVLQKGVPVLVEFLGKAVAGDVTKIHLGIKVITEVIQKNLSGIDVLAVVEQKSELLRQAYDRTHDEQRQSLLKYLNDLSIEELKFLKGATNLMPEHSFPLESDGQNKFVINIPVYYKEGQTIANTLEEYSRRAYAQQKDFKNMKIILLLNGPKEDFYDPANRALKQKTIDIIKSKTDEIRKKNPHFNVALFEHEYDYQRERSDAEKKGKEVPRLNMGRIRSDLGNLTLMDLLAAGQSVDFRHCFLQVADADLVQLGRDVGTKQSQTFLDRYNAFLDENKYDIFGGQYVLPKAELYSDHVLYFNDYFRTACRLLKASRVQRQLGYFMEANTVFNSMAYFKNGGFDRVNSLSSESKVVVDRITRGNQKEIEDTMEEFLRSELEKADVKVDENVSFEDVVKRYESLPIKHFPDVRQEINRRLGRRIKSHSGVAVVTSARRHGSLYHRNLSQSASYAGFVSGYGKSGDISGAYANEKGEKAKIVKNISEPGFEEELSYGIVKWLNYELSMTTQSAYMEDSADLNKTFRAMGDTLVYQYEYAKFLNSEPKKIKEYLTSYTKEEQSTLSRKQLDVIAGALKNVDLSNISAKSFPDFQNELASRMRNCLNISLLSKQLKLPPIDTEAAVESFIQKWLHEMISNMSQYWDKVLKSALFYSGLRLDTESTNLSVKVLDMAVQKLGLT